MDVLESKYVVLRIIGEHAGESEIDVFLRKRKEIHEAGKSFWLIKSNKAKTENIQEISKKAEKEGEKVYVLFIHAATNGGARPTKKEDIAHHYSSDNNNWSIIENGIKVTGKIDRSSTALVLKNLEVFNKEDVIIDLWNYSDFFDSLSRIKTGLGSSTVCAVKKYCEGMK